MSNLHAQIMNLQLKQGWREEFDPFEELAYKVGHRDARHAAAGLALAQDARICQLEEALNHIVRRLQMDIDDGSRPDQWSMEDLVRKARAALKEPS